jgi:hypothetical protein
LQYAYIVIVTYTTSYIYFCNIQIKHLNISLKRLKHLKRVTVTGNHGLLVGNCGRQQTRVRGCRELPSVCPDAGTCLPFLLWCLRSAAAHAWPRHGAQRSTRWGPGVAHPHWRRRAVGERRSHRHWGKEISLSFRETVKYLRWSGAVLLGSMAAQA